MSVVHPSVRVQSDWHGGDTFWVEVEGHRVWAANKPSGDLDVSDSTCITASKLSAKSLLLNDVRVSAPDLSSVLPAPVHCVAVNGIGSAVAGCANGKAYVLPGWVGDSSALASPDDRLELDGHLLDVLCTSWFPSDRVVLTGGSDLCLKIWSAETGSCAATLKGHLGGVLGTAIVDRGRNVLSCSRDGTVRLWDVSAQGIIATFNCGSGAPSLSSSPSSSSSSAGAGSGSGAGAVDVEPSAVPTTAAFPVFDICLLPSSSDALAGIPAAPSSFTPPAAHPKEVGTDGRIAVAACGDGRLRLLDVRCRRVATVLTHEDHSSSGSSGAALNTCTASSDGLVATGDDAGAVTVWDLRTGGAPMVVSQSVGVTSPPAAVLSVTGLTSDSVTVASADGSVCVLPLGPGPTKSVYTGAPHGEPVRSVYSGPLGIVTGCADGVLRQYSL